VHMHGASDGCTVCTSALRETESLAATADDESFATKGLSARRRLAPSLADARLAATGCTA
jgi:hypothetical protein